MMKAFYHQPVLVKETMAFLSPKAGDLFFEGTVGGGGHTSLLLQAGASVIGCDRDPQALAHSQKMLTSKQPRKSSLTLVEACYSNASEILLQAGKKAVDGILLDLGVSSYQLDEPSRGFSFQQEGPLDMRMGRSERTAATLLAEASCEELIYYFKTYGEEPRAVSLAHKIVAYRKHTAITTTTALAKLIAQGAPYQKKHPATRVFQALRIAVNKELEELETFLKSLPKLLVAGGRVAIITFHSLEDRIVKHFFRKHSQKEIDDPTWPAPRPNPAFFFELPRPFSFTPTITEQKQNPRSRSSRLRVAYRNHHPMPL